MRTSVDTNRRRASPGLRSPSPCLAQRSALTLDLPRLDLAWLARVARSAPVYQDRRRGGSGPSASARLGYRICTTIQVHSMWLQRIVQGVAPCPFAKEYSRTRMDAFWGKMKASTYSGKGSVVARGGGVHEAGVYYQCGHRPQCPTQRLYRVTFITYPILSGRCAPDKATAPESHVAAAALTATRPYVFSIKSHADRNKCVHRYTQAGPLEHCRPWFNDQNGLPHVVVTQGQSS